MDDQQKASSESFEEPSRLCPEVEDGPPADRSRPRNIGEPVGSDDADPGRVEMSPSITGKLRPSQYTVDLTQLLDNIDVAFSLLDLRQRKRLYVSPAFQRIWGVDPEVIIHDPRNILNYVFPDDLESVLAAYQKRLTGQRAEIEYRIVRPDGQIRWVHSRCFPIADLDGEVNRMVDITEDISGRKQMEGELAERGNLYRLLADNVTDLVVRHDLRGKILYASPSIKQLLDYEPDEVLDHNLPEFIHEDDVDAVQASMRKLSIRIQDVVSLENRIRRRDGSWLWVETMIKLVEATAPDHADSLVAVSRDITARKKAEKRLQRSHENLELRIQERTVELQRINSDLQATQAKLKATLQALPDILLEMDNQGLIHEFHTPTGERLGGLSPAAVGKRIVEVLPEAPSEIIMNALGKTCAAGRDTGAVFSLEVDGSLRWFELSIAAKPIITPMDSRYIVLVREITTHKHTQNELIRYQSRLKEIVTGNSLAEERERRHIATELHDNIGGCVAMAKMLLKTMKESYSALDDDKSCGELSNLLDMISRATRSLTMDISPPILYELGLQAALDWLAEEMTKKYDVPINCIIRTRFDVTKNDIKVILFRAARELLLNAVKHAQSRTIVMCVRQLNGSFVIQVNDDGIGFDKDIKEYIKENNNGHGLLSTIERLQSIEAELVFHSEKNIGTEARIIVPLEVIENA